MNTKQKKKNKKRLWMLSVAGIAIAALIAAFVLSPKGTGAFQAEQAQTADITTYYSFSGALEAKNREMLMSEQMMQVDELKVSEGDSVKSGDVLLITKQGEEIKAPIDGEVAAIFVEENAELMAGAQLIEIVDYSALQASVKVGEHNLKFLEVGKAVTVTVNALEKEIEGTIAELSKEATNENGISYFTAIIDLADDEALRVGMSAEAKVLKAEAKGVTTLPMKVVQFDGQNKPYVLLPSEKGLPAKKYITTGINDGMVIEVKSGVAEGDTVMFTDNEEAQAAAAMQGDAEK